MSERRPNVMGVWCEREWAIADAEKELCLHLDI